MSTQTKNEDRLSKKWVFSAGDNKHKTIEIIHGDMCELQEQCDIAVCSAFRESYEPTRGTLIEAMYIKHGINTEKLSVCPEMDFKNIGCWLSRETDTPFRRIACIELLDLEHYYDDYRNSALIMQKGFSMLRFLIEQANISGIPVETIAMPLLGGGCQRIELEYILAPMIAQCKHIIECEDNVKEIIIYERNLQKAQKMIASFESVFESTKQSSDVFISYCTKQAEEAQKIFDFLTSNNISCWMAPLSIPAGASYIEEIPIAISKMKTLLLVLTPDAENSRWVQKEVSSAIGSNKALLPYMPYEYEVGTKFAFMLDGEQILPGYLLGQDNMDVLYKRIVELNSK